MVTALTKTDSDIYYVTVKALIVGFFNLNISESEAIWAWKVLQFLVLIGAA